jgi:DNA polymerase-3 subunit epsilon
MALLPQDLVYFDTETTGLRTDYDRIVSLSGLIQKGGKRFTFNALVNPRVPIPDEATRVHSITDDRVARADTFRHVGERFFAWVYEHAGDEPVLAAYNGHRYDFEILYYELLRWKCVLPRFKSLRGYDPLKAARVLLKHLPSKKQCEVYRHLYGTEPADQHDSMGDVLAMERIVGHTVFASSIKEHTKHLTAFEFKLHERPPCAQRARARATRE